ncbi:efflux RND transporter permease subunit [Brucepastera parasyntrophica]|uniref:efflux RND transporter permease subunit n=1 Tax=Brucepastera parasyntrophica TaxID=2880008 RepID=UPI00210D6445|nr:efflux RND transporter permease subunit [Brucepastera parasyntrophica]ULQ60869.1 efflux RND transporter permease subunit [Brucepastera parasyntrophica]
MSIAKQVVGRPVLLAVIFALIAIVGIYLVFDVAIDMFPETNMPLLVVSATYSGAGPETVEKTVTKLLESSLVNLSGLKEMTSTSSENSSLVMLEFEYGTDLDNKINEVRDKLDRIKRSLPDDVDTPIIMQFDPSSMPIMSIAIRGNRTQNELRSIAEDTIQDRLEQIDGVASTSVRGGQSEIVKVALSQNRLEAYGLTITSIASKLAQQNVELGAGSIEDGDKNYSIRTTGEYTSIQDIAGTVVAQKNGSDIRLQDIGTVSMGFEDETSTVYINGESGVYISVTKQSGTNSVSVADKVYTRIDEIRADLPADITLEIISDNTDQIRGMINELINSAVLGIILAVIILFIFLRNIKSTIIIGISIPFSILVTLLVMSLAGITLNMMTLTGLILGVGMIVDSSIVILENIYKFRERGAKPTIAAILGSQEVMSSIISSTLTTICVFVPILLFKNRLGMIGELFQGMIFTVAIALAASLMVAIFLVPVLASTYLPINTRKQKPLKNGVLKKIDDAVDAALKAITRGYRRLLTAAINHRVVTVVLVIAAFIGSVGALSKMNITFIPPMNDDSVTLNLELPLGTTYEETKAVMLQLQEFAIDEIVGAKSITVNVGSTGRAMNTGQNTHKGDMTVNLDINNKNADTSEQVREKLRTHFKDFPNANLSFGQSRSQAIAGGSDIDIVLRVDDIHTGLAAANEIAAVIEEFVPELTEVSIDTTEGLPQVEVVIDRNRAYNMGLNISNIASEISASMNGVTATTFRHSGDEYSVVLMLQESDRKKLPDLERIFVASTAGNLVPVSNFARLEKGLGPVSINRENQTRVIHVTGSMAEGNRADAVESKIKAALTDNFVAPTGVTVGFEGQWNDIMETLVTFILIATLAILLVFGVMAGQYESFKDPIINLCTIPLMLIGVVLIYLLTGQTISTFTLVGIVMLVGIVVNNGIILVDYTNLLVGRGVSVREACIDAGESRLRPVLMTTLTTILGLVPMAFFPGESSMMIQPIGLTVIGGLTSSTFITLLFIPVMYSFLNERRKGKKKQTLELEDIHTDENRPEISGPDK